MLGLFFVGVPPAPVEPRGRLARGLSSLRPSWRRASAGIGPIAAPVGADAMAICSAERSSAVVAPFCRIPAESPFCRPEEDPFLLLESSLKAIERILQLRRGLPLRRTWIEQPYGEEEITRLEEEVMPAIQGCLARIEELDQRLLAEQELLQRCQLEAERRELA